MILPFMILMLLSCCTGELSVTFQVKHLKNDTEKSETHMIGNVGEISRPQSSVPNLKVSENCFNPKVFYRVSSNNYFWRIPKRHGTGTAVVTSNIHKQKNMWIMEYINVTTAKPRYAIRTRKNPQLYITFDGSGEVSLQPLSENSYFLFELGSSGGYVYRTPGGNKTLGVRNQRLHLVEENYEWSVLLRGERKLCKGGRYDRLAVRDLMTDVMWYRDRDFSSDNNIHVDRQGGTPVEAQWLSKMDATFTGRYFRSFEDPAKVIFRTTADELKISNITPQMSNRIEIFEAMQGFSHSTKFFASNPLKYVSIRSSNGFSPDILALDFEIQAIDWVHTSLGFCCEGTCFPSTLHPQCVASPGNSS